MSSRTHATSIILLTAVVLLIQSGCREKTSRWDSVQEATEGKTASDSSKERLRLDPTLVQSDEEAMSSGNEDLGQIPPFNPDDESAKSSELIDWKPKELQSDPVTEPEIDFKSLVIGEPFPGSVFNKYFPEQGNGYDMVAKQEKEGFAQYSLRQAGDEIGQLSITDLRSNPAAAVKFESPDMNIANYPAMKDGSKGTTLLVAGRFQVKIRSPKGQLNQQDRATWLKKFNLEGIEALVE